MFCDFSFRYCFLSYFFFFNAVSCMTLYEMSSFWAFTEIRSLAFSFLLISLFLLRFNPLLYMLPYGPRQTNLCLRAFRHGKFSLRMPSHSEGPGIWLSVWRFLLTHCLYERAANVLARLRGSAGSPEPSLLAQALSTKFPWRGPH